MGQYQDAHLVLSIYNRGFRNSKGTGALDLCVFVPDFSVCTQRMKGEMDKIIGYYAMFRLRCGFFKELYMSRAEIDNHARKYSSAYRYDLNDGKQSSKWSTDFDAMARKTVIKLLLSRWGILSIDMQRAMQDDQKTYDGTGEGTYGDNQPDVLAAAHVEDPFLQAGETPLELPAPEKNVLPEVPVQEAGEPEELDITMM